MRIEFTYDPTQDKPADDAAPAKPSFPDRFDARRRLQAIENAGFSRIIIDEAGGLSTSLSLAAQALRHTHSIGIALTHRSGLVEPVAAANQFAALDDGRLSLRMAQSDGGHPAALDHEAAQQRTDEYLVLLKRLWSNDAPFDHEGPFYRVRGGFVEGKGAQGGCIPIRMGGLSGTALKIAARHASVFEIGGGTRDDILRLVERAKAASAEYGRTNSLRFALTVRVYMDAKSRALDARPDAGEAVVLTGSPAQLTASLLAYKDLGITDFVVRGLASQDAVERFAADVIPLVTKSVARAEHVVRTVSGGFHPVSGLSGPRHA